MRVCVNRGVQVNKRLGRVAAVTLVTAALSMSACAADDVPTADVVSTGQTARQVPPTVAPAPTGTPALPVAPAPTLAPKLSCAAQVLSHLSLAQEVGQLFVEGVGRTPTQAELADISRYHLGGALLAHNSYAGVAATSTVSRRLQAAATAGGVPLWVSADQEGGFVQHLHGPGFSRMPTALTQGRLGPGTLRERASSWGSQLRRAGVNLNLAPVADTVSAELGGRNRPIGYYYREYGHVPSVVTSHVLAVRRGMQDAHVQTVVKHFPGLGRVRGNTDTRYGVTDHATTRHGRYALQPFRAAVHDGARVVMLSSARYAQIDPDHIGPFSPTIIRGMLRRDLDFSGVVMSDSLTAVALSRVPVPRRAVDFLRAGGDVALVGESSALPSMVQAVLRLARTDPGFRLIVDAAALRVLETKRRQGLLPQIDPPCESAGDGEE